MDPSTSGRTARSLEPLHALCYFSPDVDAAIMEAGVPKGRGVYFAGRAAAMGAVGPGTITATFYNFAPSLVAHVVPACWESTTPEKVVAARYRGIDTTYRRLLGDDLVASPEVAEAAELARTAAQACTPEGRPLYAAHADLDWPTEPHLRLWHALTLLREHRGDGHIAALVAADLSGAEALVTHTATGKGFTVGAAQKTRGYSAEDWQAAVDGLAERGLMSTDGGLSDAGQALRKDVEATTNRLGDAPWEALGDEGTTRLAELGAPLVRTALGNGAFPDGVFASR
ncbi:hypothetical protein GCM10011519_30560 [Marmoricola endophyticus]|uniref:SalK n=1 Tax=Marmoricola endophyticus TaxID=2040280 RepID=A0A917BSQ1_9ACTN|nr:hypothetical protein [Marmoricola endophyticus]GGF54545.1 hypothetical protein GCM10011519_30560 [Marmoricola endophyticus]